MRCVVFVYDFPHPKSWHGIAHLVASKKFSDLLAIGAPYVPLADSSGSRHLKARDIPSLDAATVCRSSGVPYIAVPHESPECVETLLSFGADIAVILGARVLPEAVLESTGCPTLNVHPGVLPKNRGLDAVAWAVQRDWPQAATVHRVTTRLDAGPIVSISVLGHLRSDDCIIEIATRVDALQLVLLMSTVKAIAEGDLPWEGIEGQTTGPYHSRYQWPEAQLADRLTRYRADYHEVVTRWMREEAGLVERLGDGFEVLV